MPGLTASHWRWDVAPDECFVRIRNGESIGVVRCFHRRLVHAALSFHVVGLGGVFVAEPYRRKGHGRALLTHALAALRARTALVAAVLYARPPSSALYAGLGFVCIQPELWAYPLVPGVQFAAQDWAILNAPWTLEPHGRF